MRGLSWCGALWIVGSLLRGPAAASPCAAPTTPAALGDLAKQLSRSRRPSQWTTLGERAEALAHAGGPGAGCAHYLAGSASFLLSSRRGSERANHAARAVRHFSAAQALTPRAMQALQPRMRLKTAWARLGRVPGWLPKASKPVAVELPALAAGAKLLFSPAPGSAWAGPPFKLERTAGPPRSLLLRPGRWLVTLHGACGTTERTLVLSEAGPIDLPSPAPCAAPLLVQDDGKAVLGVVGSNSAGAVDLNALDGAMGAFELTAPGYQPKTVKPPRTGGPWTVELTRCAVALHVATDPADAELRFERIASWGPRRVRARRSGYAPLNQVVEVPKPDGPCADATHEVLVRLERPVSLRALDPSDEPVSVSRLLVDGVERSPAGFSMVPGAYVFQAHHPSYGVALGRLEVRPCLQARCSAPVLTARFGAGAGGESGIFSPSLTIGVGGALVLAGLVAGTAAWSTQGQIDGYDTRVVESDPLDSLVDRRNEQTAAANVLVGTGAATLAAGLIWRWLDDGDDS